MLSSTSSSRALLPLPATRPLHHRPGPFPTSLVAACCPRHHCHYRPLAGACRKLPQVNGSPIPTTLSTLHPPPSTTTARLARHVLSRSLHVLWPPRQMIASFCTQWTLCAPVLSCSDKVEALVILLCRLVQAACAYRHGRKGLAIWLCVAIQNQHDFSYHT